MIATSWGFTKSLHLASQLAHGLSIRPLFEIFGSLVPDRLNVDVLTVNARIKALPVEVADSAALQGDDLPCPVGMGFDHGSPERHVDALVALISDCQCAFVTLLPISHLD